MKVLICGPEPSLKGGVTIWMKMVLEFFLSHTHPDIEVAHMPIKRSASLTHMLPIYKKLYYAIKDYSLGFFSLRQCIRKEKYDVVHIVSSAGLGIVRDWLFVKLVKRYQISTVVHYHCGTIPEHLKTKGVLQWLLCKVLEISDKVAVLDNASLNAINKEGYTNVLKIGNPYNPDIDKVVAAGYKRESNTILFVGHVVPAKGIRELLQAVKDIPNAVLKCIGPENKYFQSELQRYIECNDFSKRVKFYGLRPSLDIFIEMSKASLFVLPTYTEGFPFVIVEAMACGCPIVSTPVGAIEEMISIDGKIQGFLVPPKDTEQLKNTIKYCLDNSIECAEKAHQARNKAVATYSVNVVMSQLVNMWCKL